MATLRAYLSLAKPRIVALLTLTGIGGYLAAGGGPPVRTAAFVVAGAATAAGAAALNCWYDRDLDRHMERTRDRPLPAGDLSPRAAAATGVGLLAAGAAVGLLGLPAATVAWMWFGAAAYLGLYTVALKRRHPVGVVLGGSAGSAPVLAGWAAANPGDPLSVAAPGPLVVAALVFAWTPGHAWALATAFREDFAAAGVPTLPAVAPRNRVRRAVWVSAVAAVGLAACAVATGGPVTLGAAAVAGPAYLLSAARYRRAGGDPAAVRSFFDSNLFLAAVVAAWGLDGVVAAPAVPAGVATAVAVAVAFRLVHRRRPSLGDVRAPPPGPLVVRERSWVALARADPPQVWPGRRSRRGGQSSPPRRDGSEEGAA